MLSPQDRGYYSLVIGFISLMVIFSSLGWPSASIYRIRRLKRPVSEVLSASLLGMSLSALLVIFVVLSFEDLIRARFFPGAPRALLLLALSLLPVTLFVRIFNAIARATDRFDLQNAIRVGESLLMPPLLLAALWWSEGSLWAALAVLAGVRILSMLAISIGVLHRDRLGRFKQTEMFASLRFGLRSMMLILAQQLHAQLDIFMLVALRGLPAEIAFYSQAVALARMPRLITEALATALLPKLAGLPADEAAHFTARLLRILSLLLSLTTLCVSLGGALLIPLIYGEPYAASIAPFIILAPGLLIVAISDILGRYFVALGRQGLPLMAQSLGLCINLLLNLVLIPRYGIFGAALASLSSYLICTLWLTQIFSKHSGLSWREALLFKSSDWALIRSRLLKRKH